MHSRTLHGVAKMAIGMGLLSLLNVVCGGDARCQTPGPPAPNPKELHGGIEVSLRSVRAIVLRVPTNAEKDNVPRIINSDQQNPSAPFPKDDKPTPEYIRDLAQTVQKLSEKLQREFRVPPDQIHLLGLSDLAGQTRADLPREVQNIVGREIKIGRASCRERVEVSGVAVSVEREC